MTSFNKLSSKETNEAICYNPLSKEIKQAYSSIRPHGPQEHFCYAPSANLTFSFSGQVFAYTCNWIISHDCYPNNSIDEIWHGKEATLESDFFDRVNEYFVDSVESEGAEFKEKIKQIEARITEPELIEKFYSLIASAPIEILIE